MRETARPLLERAARIYKTNKEASAALGIDMRSFGRACRRHGIETPYVRKRRIWRQQQETRISVS